MSVHQRILAPRRKQSARCGTLSKSNGLLLTTRYAVSPSEIRAVLAFGCSSSIITSPNSALDSPSMVQPMLGHRHQNKRADKTGASTTLGRVSVCPILGRFVDFLEAPTPARGADHGRNSHKRTVGLQ